MKDEESKSSLLLLTHMLTWVKRRTLFHLFFLSLFHICPLVRRRELFACFSLTHSHFYIGKTKSLICLFFSHSLTFTLVRRRTLFAYFSLTHSHLYICKTKSLICLFFSHSFTLLGEGGGFLLHMPESHQCLIGERVWFAPPLFHYFFLIVLTWLVCVFWCPSTPGACEAMRYEGLWDWHEQ